MEKMNSKDKEQVLFPYRRMTLVNSISSKIVEKTWEKVGSMSPLQGQKMIEQMSKQQPVILAYLMAVGDDLFNEDERELLLYLGVVVWQIMLQGDAPLSKVTEKALDKAERTNIKMLERFTNRSLNQMAKGVKEMLGNYNQKEVLSYVVEALMEEPEEGCLIRDEVKGIMMIFLKTVIDCFDIGVHQ
jgi:hypothetical protein